MNNRTAANIRKTAGFTLLEALIALLILSIGILGVASLQTTSTRLNTDSHMRVVTTQAASDIINIIRNHTGKLPRLERPGKVTEFAGASEGACDPFVSNIDNDYSCWLENLEREVPGSTGIITDNGGGFLTVRIEWYDRDNNTQFVEWDFMAGVRQL
jgi:type IV pilus assembly protein PilV